MRIAILLGVCCLLFGAAWGRDENLRSQRVQEVSAVLWPDTAEASAVQAARGRVAADGTAYNEILDAQFFVDNCAVEKLMQSSLPEFLLLTARTDPAGSYRLAKRYQGLLQASLLLQERIPRKPELMGNELPVFILKIEAALRQAGELTRAIPPADDLNACGLHRFRFNSLAVGGRIYLCKVGTIEESPEHNIPTITYGQVELRVVKTLLGHGTTWLRVPYNYGEAKSDYAAFWPDMSKLSKEHLLLCVFLPGGYDAASGELPGTDGAMSEVIPVTGEDDPQVKAMQAYANLYLESDPAALHTKLQAALSQGDDPVLREFAFQMLRVYAREGQLAEAVGLAYRHLSDPKAATIPESDLGSDMSLLDALGNTAQPAARRQVLHALGLLAQSPVPYIATHATTYFLDKVQWYKEAKPLFTAEERATLATTLTQRLAGTPTDEERKAYTEFQQWLEGKP
ncbi:MAG: hypothetical protein ACYDBB_18265 [Armatimonadota bacterium]